VTVGENSVKLLSGRQKLSPARCKFIVTEKFFEVEIEVVEKRPEETPISGAP
jgi:hypothetical protein